MKSLALVAAIWNVQPAPSRKEVYQRVLKQISNADTEETPTMESLCISRFGCSRGNVEVDASWKGGLALSAALRPGTAGEFHLRPPPGQRIARIRTGARTISATESGGIWRVWLERRHEYTITF